MLEQIELVENEAEAPAVTNPLAGLPIITITWDPCRGVVALNFDEKKFATPQLIIAAFDMAKEFVKLQMEMQQMAAMRQQALEQQNAAAIQAQVQREQRNHRR
jgi:hypothetical protein